MEAEKLVPQGIRCDVQELDLMVDSQSSAAVYDLLIGQSLLQKRR
jgi:hypothetical protein